MLRALMLLCCLGLASAESAPAASGPHPSASDKSVPASGRAALKALDAAHASAMAAWSEHKAKAIPAAEQLESDKAAGEASLAFVEAQRACVADALADPADRAALRIKAAKTDDDRLLNAALDAYPWTDGSRSSVGAPCIVGMAQGKAQHIGWLLEVCGGAEGRYPEDASKVRAARDEHAKHAAKSKLSPAKHAR